MKRMKTLLSVILVVVLALSLSVTAFAAGGTIRILDPVDTKEYKAYKIFDVEKDSHGDFVYTLDDTSQWKDVLMDSSGNSLIRGLTFTPDANPATEYTVTKGPGFSSADFAQTLKAAAAGMTTDGSTTYDANPADPTQITDRFAVAENGYYLITSTTGNTAALTTVYDGDVSVQDKNDMPFDKVIVDGADEVDEDAVNVGDIVSFKITGKVPAHDANITACSYIVSDTMDAGLDFDETTGVTVTINGTAVSPLTVVTDPNAILTGDQIRYTANGFELSLEMLARGKDTTLQGKDIVITYQATVTDAARRTISENKATLEYVDDNDTFTKTDETKVYVVEIIVDKYETGAPEQKLAGAEFVLYKMEGTAKKYYRFNEDTKALTWIDCADPAAAGVALEHVVDASDPTAITKVVTNDEGAASFTGLDDGTYYLHEIKAPDGYSPLTDADDVAIVVNTTGVTDPTLTPTVVAQMLTNYAHVANTPKSVLPSTGGRGATMLYIAGLALIFVSGAYLVLRKRCEA